MMILQRADWKSAVQHLHISCWMLLSDFQEIKKNYECDNSIILKVYFDI